MQFVFLAEAVKTSLFLQLAVQNTESPYPLLPSHD